MWENKERLEWEKCISNKFYGVLDMKKESSIYKTKGGQNKKAIYGFFKDDIRLYMSHNRLWAIKIEGFFKRVIT